MKKQDEQAEELEKQYEKLYRTNLLRNEHIFDDD